MTCLVLVLDDVSSFRDTLEIVLARGGFTFRGHSEPQSFLSDVETHSGPSVLIVDHDLGISTFGYEVVKQIRLMRPDGMTIPIIYLTGRESEIGYLQQALVDPYSMPSVYISKSKMAEVDLRAIVERLSRLAGEAQDAADRQAARRASRFLASLDALDIDGDDK